MRAINHFKPAVFALFFMMAALISPFAHAQTSSTPSRAEIETSIFRGSIPAGDTVAQVVFSIFPSLLGTVGGPQPGSFQNGAIGSDTIAGIPTATVVSTLPSIIGVFNVCVLLLTIVVVMYQSTVWLVDIGKDGKWDSQGAGMSAIWSPIRLAAGLLLMVPVPGGQGWNPAQYAIGTIAHLGYNIGQYTWTYAVKLSGTDHRTALVPPINPTLPNTISLIGFAEICRQSHNLVENYFSSRSADGNGQPPGMIWLVTETNEEKTWSVGPNPARMTAVARKLGDACGVIRFKKGYTFSDEAIRAGQRSEFLADQQSKRRQYEQMSVTAHDAAITATLARAQQLSNEIIAALIKSDPNLAMTIGMSVERYMREGVIGYASKLQETSSAILSDLASRRYSPESQFQNIVNNAGWTNAGYFMLTYANLSSSAAGVARNTPDVRGPSLDNLLGPTARGWFDYANTGGLLLTVRDEFARFVSPNAPDWYKAATGTQSGTAKARTEFGQNVSDAVSKGVLDFMAPIARAIDPLSSWNPNPIPSMIELGHTIINVSAPILFISSIADLIPGGNATKTVGAAVVGFFTAGPIAATAMTAVAALSATIAKPLLLLGILYAYVIPMIVWAMWAVFVLGWIMLLCEAMMVASLWALAHARMDGDSGFGQHTKHGYGAVVSLAIRPAIGAIALPLSILIYSLVVNASTAAAYKYSVPAMTADNTFGPIGLLVVMMMVGIFQITLLVWCLNLPNVIVENVNAWLDISAGPTYRTGEAAGQIASMGTAAGAAQLTDAGSAAFTGAVSAAARRISGTRGQARAAEDADSRTGEKQAPKAQTGGGVELQAPVKNTGPTIN
jgi:conjugal transfer/type IV secretion protein DotA/TraY